MVDIEEVKETVEMVQREEIVGMVDNEKCRKNETENELR